MNTETKASHTPGPWTMETVRTSAGVCFKVGPFPWKEGKLNHACIYADYPSSREHAECEANARLIAAAPDLLEALLEFQRGFADGSIKFVKQRQSDSDPYHPANIKMCAAIAKAEWMGEPGETLKY